MGEPFTFQPVNGQAGSKYGIFRDAYTGVDTDGVSIATVEPTIGVRLSDFSQAPRRMDICIIRGVTYRVLRSEPDGDGGSMLYLEKTGVS
ncbi:hypothetical protein VF14_18425 [Nostoc linckia z18]|uniref:Uncharacterized protein n=3 Tax=Nostoc linckia TaxID=92942 RepID=A0A9Q6EJI4_NOSLI|nr:hypothetical protein VF07_29105 [Nostoc linckia z6]PHJ92882.1 hypothetical protein VF04_27820 [Nostoc linckia z7]PHK00830.1 hypothetical protein VF08_23425 [Nostoc linckia z8]PHK09362.1 hypothetical protein VF09_15880 [Nostoc linckia z9]PHK33119.1 hypothetical protein VF14_18425 [Nostoc linckia z18]